MCIDTGISDFIFNAIHHQKATDRAVLFRYHVYIIGITKSSVNTLDIVIHLSMTIPIYFTAGQWMHGSFSKIFEDQNYFKDREIKILHLGAYTGHGTRWMLERVKGTCVDVDVWKNPGDLDSSLNRQHYDLFYTDNNVEALYDKTVSGLPTTKFKGTTAEFFAQNEETFDFIYIDASHKKADVALDLEQSWQILNVDGVIACDDYLWHTELDPSNPPTDNYELIPYEAIKEFAEEHEKEIEVLIDGYQFWFKKLAD
jgi:hypothetical protein